MCETDKTKGDKTEINKRGEANRTERPERTEKTNRARQVLTRQDDHVHSPEDAHDPSDHDNSCQYLDEGRRHVEPEHTTHPSLWDQLAASAAQHRECRDERSCERDKKQQQKTVKLQWMKTTQCMKNNGAFGSKWRKRFGVFPLWLVSREAEQTADFSFEMKQRRRRFASTENMPPAHSSVIHSGGLS